MAEYLFIDGEYFRRAFEGSMQTFFGTVPLIDYNGGLTRTLGRFDRIYYYDAVDRNQVGDETPAQAEARATARDEFHAYLNSIPCWSVREGFVSRGRRAKRRAQKGVDVQLAVDALEHAVARNLSGATFILGDLDFEPLFFSLNRFGVKTTVWYEPGTASSELLESADVRRRLDIQLFHSMTQPSFRDAVRSPTFDGDGSYPGAPYRVTRRGAWNGRAIETLVDGHSVFVWARPGRDPGREPQVYVNFSGTDLDRTAKAFEMTYGGEIRWDESS